MMNPDYGTDDTSVTNDRSESIRPYPHISDEAFNAAMISLGDHEPVDVFEYALFALGVAHLHEGATWLEWAAKRLDDVNYPRPVADLLREWADQLRQEAKR